VAIEESGALDGCDGLHDGADVRCILEFGNKNAHGRDFIF
jgi:hypothetical protein